MVGNVVGNILGHKRIVDSKSKNFTAQGHNCDKCGYSLSEKDYVAPRSWSYKCPSCGFKYVHGVTELK